MNNLRTAIQPDPTYIVVFSLDAQVAFRYSSSLKKQVLIKRGRTLDGTGEGLFRVPRNGV